MVATAGATVFDGGNTYRLSGQTTESGDTPQNRVIQFREDPSNSHGNVDIALNGDITLTGNIAQGALNFGWQWEYAGQAGWTDGGSLSITVNAPAPAPVQPPAPTEHDGTGNATRDTLEGDDGSGAAVVDHFKVDNDYSSDLALADVIRNFSRSHGDKIDLPDADFPDGTTVYYEASDVLTDDAANEVVLYKDNAKTEVIAIIDAADYVPEAGDFLDAGIVVQEIT